MIKSLISAIICTACLSPVIASPLTSLSFSGIENKNPTSITKTLLDQGAVTESVGKAEKINDIIAYGKSFIGTPYVYGGTTPNGFDCSGLVQYVYHQAGINLPRTSNAQFQALTEVDEPEIGDLVFFSHGKRISHVGIYVGDNNMLHAPSTGKRVQITSLDNAYWQKRYVGARRIADRQLGNDSLQIVAQNTSATATVELGQQPEHKNGNGNGNEHEQTQPPTVLLLQ